MRVLHWAGWGMMSLILIEKRTYLRTLNTYTEASFLKQSWCLRNGFQLSWRVRAKVGTYASFKKLPCGVAILWTADKCYMNLTEELHTDPKQWDTSALICLFTFLIPRDRDADFELTILYFLQKSLVWSVNFMYNFNSCQKIALKKEKMFFFLLKTRGHLGREASKM
jgi:hypothetical protein